MIFRGGVDAKLNTPLGVSPPMPGFDGAPPAGAVAASKDVAETIA